MNGVEPNAMNLCIQIIKSFIYAFRLTIRWLG